MYILAQTSMLHINLPYGLCWHALVNIHVSYHDIRKGTCSAHQQDSLGQLVHDTLAHTGIYSSLWQTNAQVTHAICNCDGNQSQLSGSTKPSFLPLHRISLGLVTLLYMKKALNSEIYYSAEKVSIFWTPSQQL